jgi:hypothetical protein
MSLSFNSIDSDFSRLHVPGNLQYLRHYLSVANSYFARKQEFIHWPPYRGFFCNLFFFLFGVGSQNQLVSKSAMLLGYGHLIRVGCLLLVVAVVLVAKVQPFSWNLGPS